MKFSVRMKGYNEKLMILISRLASLQLCPDPGWSQGENALGLTPKHFAFSKRSLISILRWSGRLVSHLKCVTAAFSSPFVTNTPVQLFFCTESCL